MRTPDQDEELIHTAHASRYHWSVLIAHGEGTAKNAARGDWLLARVYALCRRADVAREYGERALARSESDGLGPFDRAFAHEAIARAFALDGDAEQARTHRDAAERLAVEIEDANDRAWLLENLETIPRP